MFDFIKKVLDDEESSALRVQSVDLLFEANGQTHRTEEYDLMEKTQQNGGRLIVRRGQQFLVKVTFDRKYCSHEDDVWFVFRYKNAAFPSYRHDTQETAKLHDDKDGADGEKVETHWTAIRTHKEEHTVTIALRTASDALVGQWSMEIDTKLKDKGVPVSYEVDSPFYVLFNPWCKEDSCFMDDHEALKEYVLNDSGSIWKGASNSMKPRVWIYGQFEEDILDCSLELLHAVTKLRPRFMGDPVAVTRAISSAVNSNDNNGVLAGNWGETTEGVSPLSWVGSVKILQQFYKTKEPVLWGQCWVFAGVLTTLCRTLGIPARPVTNFNSAHDTQSSLTIDYFFDEEGEPVEDLNTDSIWNFHVWVETWMTRPDLSPGDYDGWQAIDATPQEVSEGIFRCGPASVKAIRGGEIKKPYDGIFLYSEVNADEVYWKYFGRDKPLKLVGQDNIKVGRNISTKAIGKNEREDITHLYKPEEGGVSERSKMHRALDECGGILSRIYKSEMREDIQCYLEPMDFVVLGEPFTVRLRINNMNEGEDHVVSGVLTASTIKYTGAHFKTIKTMKFEETVASGTETIVSMEVTADEYYPHLTDHAALAMSALAKMEGTDYEYFSRDNFRVGKPEIDITVSGELKAGEEFTVTAKFTNPLSIPITDGQFHFEASGIIGEERTIACIGDVDPGADISAICTMKPRILGTKTIGVSFNCAQLDDVDGFLEVEVASRFS